ncbi:MAG TPA: choice-of-anchor P family protein, partial [Blastocatellia bacterium]|nr:choice-of-anchor P family protein [Blastocatellia bacterium]
MDTSRKILLLAVSVLMATGPASLLAQSQNSVGGTANGGSANITATVGGLNANARVLPVAPVNLPSQGGSDTKQVASVFAELGVAGVMTVLSTGLVNNSTSGSVTQSAAHAESTSTVNNLNILNGFVTAATIRSSSTSDGNGDSASSTGAGSFANQLRIAGALYEQSEFAPNTRVSASATIQAQVNGLPVLVPVTGTVTINEQIGGGNGKTNSSLTVNFLHVSVSGSVAGSISLSADIVVASASSSVNFAAAPPTNHPPALNVPGPQTVQAGNTLTLAVSATDPDAGDIVTISASNVPAHAGFNQTSGNPASGQFSFTPDSSQVGTITVGFTATDNHGASTPSSVQITVTSSPPPPTNHPPTLNLPGPQVVQVGANLTFSVSASDQDSGDTVTLSASNIPSGASVTPNPSTGNPANAQVSFTPTSSQAGQTFTINFGAIDNHGASVSGSVQITVNST